MSAVLVLLAGAACRWCLHHLHQVCEVDRMSMGIDWVVLPATIMSSEL